MELPAIHILQKVINGLVAPWLNSAEINLSRKGEKKKGTAHSRDPDLHICYDRGEEMQIHFECPQSRPIVHLHGGHISSSLCQLGQQMVMVCAPVSLPPLAQPWPLRPRCGGLTSQLGHKGIPRHAHTYKHNQTRPYCATVSAAIVARGAPHCSNFIFLVPLFLILPPLTECLD